MPTPARSIESQSRWVYERSFTQVSNETKQLNLRACGAACETILEADILATSLSTTIHHAVERSPSGMEQEQVYKKVD